MAEAGEIYWLELAYDDDPSKSKKRPFIILGVDQETVTVLGLSVTSTGPSLSAEKYHDKYKVPIFNWRRYLGRPS